MLLYSFNQLFLSTYFIPGIDLSALEKMARKYLT